MSGAQVVGLRRHFRLGAWEAWNDLPPWELDLLLAALPEGQEGEVGPVADPFAEVPAGLAGL